ncbi:MAG: oxygen-independent coproporphyrinogen III oxidase [Bacteroidota bacterium]|nr:oxygen-independent coproporphyrinogen III oxidase [Bacteroidota bacterium]
MNRELLEKYNHPVPRYTSYPPANFFTDEFGPAKYMEAVDQSNEWNPQNISIYIHIPFCLKMCFFCGCNSYALRQKEVVDAYHKALLQEIKMVTSRLDKNRKVSQIHYGGGTPNAIPVEYLQKINELLFSSFQFIPDPEIAIEVNPAYLTFEQMTGLKKAGFNRFSLGIQDFDTEVLDAVNRDKPGMPVHELMAFLKQDSPEIAVNLDFIYGLPKQTALNFAETIQKAIELKPDRLVTFSYAHVPWVSKIQKKLEKVGLPASDEKIKMFEAAYSLLTQNGYEAIGMDHYANANDELTIARKNKQLHRNFQGYCTRRTTGQVYAFGVTGISQLSGVYAQNTKSIDEYIAKINQGELTTIKGYALTDQQVIVREVINELMCNEQIVWNGIGERLGFTSEEIKKNTTYNTELLQQFETDGIISLSEEKIQITADGQLFIRNVAASLDPLTQAGQTNFSKPV